MGIGSWSHLVPQFSKEPRRAEGSAFGLKHIFLDLPGILLSFPVGA